MIAELGQQVPVTPTMAKNGETFAPNNDRATGAELAVPYQPLATGTMENFSIGNRGVIGESFEQVLDCNCSATNGWSSVGCSRNFLETTESKVPGVAALTKGLSDIYEGVQDCHATQGWSSVGCGSCTRSPEAIASSVPAMAELTLAVA